MMGTARAGGGVQVLTDWVFLKPNLGEPKTGHIDQSQENGAAQVVGAKGGLEPPTVLPARS